MVSIGETNLDTTTESIHDHLDHVVRQSRIQFIQDHDARNTLHTPPLWCIVVLAVFCTGTSVLVCGNLRGDFHFRCGVVHRSSMRAMVPSAAGSVVRSGALHERVFVPSPMNVLFFFFRNQTAT